MHKMLILKIFVIVHNIRLLIFENNSFLDKIFLCMADILYELKNKIKEENLSLLYEWLAANCF